MYIQAQCIHCAAAATVARASLHSFSVRMCLASYTHLMNAPTGIPISATPSCSSSSSGMGLTAHMTAYTRALKLTRTLMNAPTGSQISATPSCSSSSSGMGLTSQATVYTSASGHVIYTGQGGGRGGPSRRGAAQVCVCVYGGGLGLGGMVVVTWIYIARST